MRAGLLTAVVCALAAAPLSAQESSASDGLVSGFYVGADVGGMNFDNACDPTALSCDHQDSSAAAFAGYRLPSRFAFELDWHELGQAGATYPRLTSTIDVIGELTAYELATLIRFPFGDKWEAYLRGGAMRWDAETRSPEFAAEESGWSPSAGAGLAWRFRPAWQARFQYLYVADIGDTATGEANVEQLSAGLSYLFGGRRSGAPAASAASASPVSSAPPSPAQPPEPPLTAAAPGPPASPPPALPACAPPLPAWESHIYFAFDSAVALDLESLSELVQRLEEHDSASIRIVGFADPSGASAYNLDLSRRRAQAVADVFRAADISEARIRVDWEGEAEAVTAPTAVESAALSRRVRVTSASVAIDDTDCGPVSQ